MTPWCRDLPVVTATSRDMPKSLTLVMPYYENPHFLKRQMAGWAAYPADLAKHLTIILVDDGSPDHPAMVKTPLPCRLRLFRIGVDVRWNWLAARNIGMHHAVDGWCLMTDMDHVLPVETLRSIIYGDHDPDVMYAFLRGEHTGEPAYPHSASFLLTRALFWRIGGYDEALSGNYGTDGEYRRRVAKVAPIHVLTDRLIRYEFVVDASTTLYQRKLPIDAQTVKRLVSARRKGWKPKTLSFPYEEVTL